MKIGVILLLICISNYLPAQSFSLRSRIRSEAKKIEQKIIQWRRDIHEHPELGNREVRTSGIVEKHLRSLGFEVKTGIAKTGVVGVLKGGKPGPVVALRADMDALPVREKDSLPFASKVMTRYNDGVETGVMHACGHDAHVAMLMGVAEIFSVIKKDLPGTVKFIFQPAEEGPPAGEEGGAEIMVREGVMKDPEVDAVFGLHMSPGLEVGKIEYRPGGAMASVNDMKIIVKGKPSHGGYPWNSVDPIVVSAQIINNLQAIVSRNLNLTQNPGVVTIGAIHGGNRSNIIPGQVEMLGTIRALSEEDEKLLVRRVREVVVKTAESAGATAEAIIPYSDHDPVVYNDPALTTQMLPTLQRIMGKENVVLMQALTAAEDFSCYQRECPGLFFWLGGMPKGQDPTKAPSLHTPGFYIDESSFRFGMEAMSSLALDYMLSAK